MDGPTEATTLAGGYISLHCTASGIPFPDIVWYKDGQVISQDERVEIINADPEQTQDTTVTQTTLSIADLRLSDAGNYICEANNTGAYATVFVVRSKPAHLSVQREHLKLLHLFLYSFTFILIHTYHLILQIIMFEKGWLNAIT